MDLNHDYTEHEPFLVTGAQQRLQMCKCAILAQGDLGYTDPAIGDIRQDIGEYTDSDGAAALEARIREILETAQLVTEGEIQSISVTSAVGADYFHVVLSFTFGTEEFEYGTAIL